MGSINIYKVFEIVICMAKGSVKKGCNLDIKVERAFDQDGSKTMQQVMESAVRIIMTSGKKKG